MRTRRHVLAVLSCLPTMVLAEMGDLPLRTSGFYIGLGGGYNTASLANDAIDISGGDLAVKAAAGYRFTPRWLPWKSYVAVEGAYLNLGEISDTTLNTEFTLETWGIDTSASAYLPITRRIDLYGKLGVFFWDAELNALGSSRDESSGADLDFGVGFAFQTPSAWSAQIEIQGFDIFDGVWTATVSAIYQFK